MAKILNPGLHEDFGHPPITDLKEVTHIAGDLNRVPNLHQLDDFLEICAPVLFGSILTIRDFVKSLHRGQKNICAGLSEMRDKINIIEKDVKILKEEIAKQQLKSEIQPMKENTKKEQPASEDADCQSCCN